MQVNTYTDSPCKEFVPHRFKKSHCSQCFKPKSQHVQQEDTLVAERISENVQLIKIKSNGIVPENKDNVLLRKSTARTKNSAIHETARSGQCRQSLAVLEGKTQQLRKQFENQETKVKQTTMSRDHKDQNGAIHSSPHPEHEDSDFLMTIPVEPSIVLLNDLNSNSNHNGAINDHYQSASDDEILSEPTTPSRFWRAKSPKPTRAMDLIPSNSLDDGGDKIDVNDVKSGPRQAWQLQSERPMSNGLQEFQRIAKRLRHVDPPPDSPTVQRKPIKQQSPWTDESSCNGMTKLEDEVDKKEKVVSEHPTLSVGCKPQESSINHSSITSPCSQESVPNLARSTKSEINPQQHNVTNNKTNSEMYLDKLSPTKSKKIWKKPDLNPGPVDKSKLDLASKPVTIKFRDGRVAHYDGSPKPFHKMSKSQEGDLDKVKSPTRVDSDQRPPAAKAYVVVDVSRDPPKGLKTSDRRSISGPPLPCTPAPRSRPVSQQSFESSDGVLESPSKYLNRSNSVDSALTESTESDMSPVKHTSVTPERPTSDNKRDTPPFPMILPTSEGYEPPEPPVKARRNRSDRRTSSGYKVPIFIQPQNYDNLGTAKSDSETKLNELPDTSLEKESPPKPPFRTASQDYLVPMRDSIGSNMSAELDASMGSGSRDSGSFSASDSESKSPQKPVASEDFRSRAQSHPPQKPEPVYAKISHDHRKLGAKGKRTAPGPPQCELDESLPDTLPRSPPPPPPPISKMNKHKRGSSEVATSVNKVNKPVHKRGSSEQATPVNKVDKSKSSQVVTPVNKVDKHKRGPAEVLVVDLSQQVPRKQHTTNIYSQTPQRKQASDPSTKVNNQEKPKSANSVVSPERGMGQNKAPAPRIRNDQIRPLPNEPSTKANVGRPLPSNPQKQLSQSVKERSSPEVHRVAAPSRNSAPVRTKDPNPSKAKAPVPTQKQVLSSRNGALSPPRNHAQNVKQDKSSSPQVIHAQSPPARTKSPLETDVPLQNDRLSPTKGKAETDCNDATSTGGSPPTRTISPLPPNSPLLGRRLVSALPDDTITGGPSSSPSKPKNKVKLPWKKRHKRKEDGSPEREFNAEPVQKWLDEIQKMQLEDKTNRHSLDRLDVINAYKGQPTATIHDSGPLPPSPLAQADHDNPDGPVPRPRNNSAVKRQAPRPPGGDAEDQAEEEVSLLQRSNPTSPITRKRHGSDGDNGNFYENVGKYQILNFQVQNFRLMSRLM